MIGTQIKILKKIWMKDKVGIQVVFRSPLNLLAEVENTFHFSIWLLFLYHLQEADI